MGRLTVLSRSREEHASHRIRYVLHTCPVFSSYLGRPESAVLSTLVDRLTPQDGEASGLDPEVLHDISAPRTLCEDFGTLVGWCTERRGGVTGFHAHRSGTIEESMRSNPYDSEGSDNRSIYSPTPIQQSSYTDNCYGGDRIDNE